MNPLAPPSFAPDAAQAPVPGFCVIHQPTYLPWIGFFDLLDQAGTYVVLDKVPFSRRSWQQRNRIKTRAGLDWLTVPVQKSPRDAAIAEIGLAGPEFARNHLETLRHNYHGAPYFTEVFPLLEQCLRRGAESGSLSRLNLECIAAVAAYLGIAPRLLLSSELPVAGHRSHLLAAILATVGHDRYLSAKGSLDYLREDAAVFRDQGVAVFLHEFTHPEYRQACPPFAPYASVVDLLFNEGPASLAVIRSGRRPPTPLAACP